ncbi:MAG: hypothetical protein RQ756_09305 [Flavobacteriaceae bacterium]|nr:hypothetical protein [Flavobacteriaceae bacterium]
MAKNNIPSDILPKQALGYKAIAARHGVSQNYVRMIDIGKRSTNTPLAQSIAAELQETKKFFTRPLAPAPAGLEE